MSQPHQALEKTEWPRGPRVRFLNLRQLAAQRRRASSLRQTPAAATRLIYSQATTPRDLHRLGANLSFASAVSYRKSARGGRRRVTLFPEWTVAG